MGCDKATLAAGAETFLGRTASALSTLFTRVHLAVGATPRYERLELPHKCLSLPLICDRDSGRGPLEGVRAALESLGRPALFVPVDLAHISAALLRALWRAACETGAVGAVSKWAGGVEPAVAVYTPALLPAVGALLEEGKRELMRLAMVPGVRLLDLSRQETLSSVFGNSPPRLDLVFQNLNTPEDFRAALAAGLAAKDFLL